MSFGQLTTSPTEVVFMLQDTVHIFLNGEFKEVGISRSLISSQDFLMAVDGGLYHILRMGLKPDLLIGDLDSVDQADVNVVEQSGVRVSKFPPEKDQTDFELALDEAVRLGPKHIFIHAAVGGRMDQTLTNLFLAGAERYASLDLVLIHGSESYCFIRKERTIPGQPGDMISLLPWEGIAEGVTTQNLRYPLQRETLYPDRSRGISNEMTTAEAVITLKTGRLLCIHTQK